MNEQKCPSCGQQMQRGSRPVTLTYKDQSETFDLPGWYCGVCGEGVHSGRDMQESDRRLNLLKAKAENVLLPSDVRRIRKKLQLTQEKAGLILGGGANAFHKYENGIVLPSQAVSNLLRVLDARPDAVAVLRKGQTELDESLGSISLR